MKKDDKKKKGKKGEFLKLVKMNIQDTFHHFHNGLYEYLESHLQQQKSNP
jgi:hypothetical protein